MSVVWIRGILALASFAFGTASSFAGSRDFDIDLIKGPTLRVTISDQQLAASPSWDAAAHDPPLPARRAIMLAKNAAGGLLEELAKKNKVIKWRFSGAALIPSQNDKLPDKYFWLVHWDADPTIPFTGPPMTFYVGVLMDGKVIKPVPVKTEKWGQ